MNSGCVDGKPHVVLRADGGRETGFGHFVRTCALAGYLSGEFRCSIVSFNPESSVPSPFQMAQIEEAGATALPLRARNLEDFNREFLEVLTGGEITVLDNYYYSTDYQRAVKSKSRALVCIDDMHDRHFTADAVMTFCPLCRSDFSLEPGTVFRGGIEWSFLRKPFLAPPSRRASCPGKLRIVMAMGGADPLRLTDKTAGAVLEADPDARLDIMAGQTVESSFSGNPRVTLHRNLDAASVARLFDSADLGIFPASTVCVEAFARRLPVAAGHFADNQEEFYAKGVAEGWFMPLGDLRDSSRTLQERMATALRALPAFRTPVFDFAKSRARTVALFRELHRR